MYHQTKDEVYAYALSKTLSKVRAPATVGLYSTCQDRISLVLKQMEAHLSSEAQLVEQERADAPAPRSTRPSLCACVSLMWKLLFYKPIWTQHNQNHRNVRFVHVHFSAWHFAGSDLLWAGMALRLFYAMQVHFGKLQLVLHRVAQYDEEDEVKKREIEDSTNDWRAKKCCCCPLWLCSLFILIIPLGFLIFYLTLGSRDPNPSEMVNNGTTSQVNMIEGLVIASFGVPAATALRFVLSTIKNLIFSQDHNIKRGMDNEKVSSKLGFMNEVRKEIWFLTRFVQFMEVFERRRIRIVLQITNVDRCPPMKIVAVLDAINILLSDEESPFIPILAVNPEILVEKVNFSDYCFIKEDQAHALLNRIVTLPFTIPPMCAYSKRTLFYNLACSGNISDKNNHIKNKSSGNIPLVEVSMDNEKHPLITSRSSFEVNEEEVETMVESIAKNTDSNLKKYILDDAMSMRRVINSFRMVVIIMKALQKDISSTENIAAWVVVANHWPCRLSWIIQCVEDAKQRAEIECTSINKLKTLWQVFEESKAELHVMREEIEEFLEQDRDPEMFEMFLKEDFQFTIKDLEILEEATVNLDHSIKKEMARIRGTSTLRDTRWKRSLAPLPITTIINMKTADVCAEMERMDFPSQYTDIVKANDLNGPALVFGDRKDLKELLGMTFGEWAKFKIRFLIFKTNKPNQNKKTEPPPQRLYLHRQHQANE
ncbi:NTPase KAP family P-loop domain-containing protein 1 [Boleophthalmus pectinirostris]|uniref:NTPase KAP family P-loop domain-containing protein 1 n=1 Tax=Boleophthalmus pectinirostris TaxID=150288 RepID=UPI00242EA5B9|nr:NTPase KAP family P-loop domain-containing protein 1 [Boleophthalmus pectinirostris]